MRTWQAFASIFATLVVSTLVYMYVYPITIQNKLIGEKIAIIYARAKFHEEVNCAVACYLYKLGYEVIVYYPLDPYTFYHQRQRDNELLYGKCVHKWIPVTTVSSVETIENVNLLVFPTYPLTYDSVRDDFAYEVLKHYAPTVAKFSFVVHIVDILPKFEFDIGKYLNYNQYSVLFLAEHVYLHAVREPLHSKQMKLGYFYPIMDTSHLIRKKGTIPADFTLQTSVGRGHSERKNPVQSMLCMNDYMKHRLHTHNASHLRLYPSTAHINFNIIGRHEAELPGMRHLNKQLSVNLISHSPVQEYYSALARGKFKITGIYDERMHACRSVKDVISVSAQENCSYTSTIINDMTNYYTVRSTASIPASFMTRTPMVLHDAFLELYPCLRDAPIHKQLSGKTECEAIHHALELTAAQYNEALDEVNYCFDQLQQHALEVLRNITM